MNRTLFLSTVVAAVLAAGGVRPAAQGQPTFGTSLELVMVDVSVTGRDGDPVLELGPDDFVLTVDGQPRRIVSTRLLRATEVGGVEAGAESMPRLGRTFVLAVDRDHIAAGEGQSMLEAASRFIDRLGPDDAVALWVLPGDGQTLRFDESRDALKKAVRQAVGTYRPLMTGGLPGRGAFNISREEALQIEEGRADVLQTVIARECVPQPEDSPRMDSCPTAVPQEARQIALEARRRAQVTLGGLGELVRLLALSDGPKHVVLITGGPAGSREELPMVDRVAAMAAQARVTIHALQVPEASYRARTDSLRASSSDTDTSLSASYFLAGLTGGLALTLPAAETAFNRLERELSAGYVLAFEAAASDRDGRLHTIAVQVRDRGFGSSVRARRTFVIDRFSSTRAADAAALARRAEAAAAAPAARAAAEPDFDDVDGEAVPAAAARVPPRAPTGSTIGEDLPSLTKALAAHVARFEHDYGALVAEERYVQMVHPWRGTPRGPEHEPALAWQDGGQAPKGLPPTISRRQLESDVLLVQVEGRDWMGFRDVAAVDGKPVRDREQRVRSLFLSGGPDTLMQLRRIADESARYNLGNFRRTLNLPTVALSFMRGGNQSRFQFKRLADQEVDGRTARVLGYIEKERPTLVRTPNGGDIPLYGRVWLDAVDGRVLRTELRFDRGGERRALIRTDYRFDEELGMLVPALMWEWYEGADQFGRIGSDKTLVQSLATYSNFRRFQVSTSEELK